ncbi:MAG: hypothetical protein ACLS61_17165 [Ruminococcus sp.]
MEIFKKNIVTVKNGIITAKKTGTANVTATVLGKKFTCKITVRKTPTSNNARPEIPTAGSGVWIPNSEVNIIGILVAVI